MMQPTGNCQQCGQRQATKIWVADGGALALVHGGAQAWCEQCVLAAQIAYARAAADRLPALEQRLAKLGADECQMPPMQPPDVGADVPGGGAV